MNKTVTINLAGMLFHIDEDAFIKLQEYLTVLKRAYANEAGAEEIISDIEARIAELFNEAKLHDLQVIDIKNVNEAIAIMGQPEDLFDEDEVEPEKQNENTTENQEQSQKKQLFRDASDGYVSGVSAGLGHYFGIDPIWLRLSWIFLVLFSGGTFFLLYISLWFFVPEAKTTAEKLAMKGKPVNVNNIEAKIKEGFNNVSDSVKSAYNNTDTDKIKSKSVEAFDKIGLILGKLFSALGFFIGLILMFGSGLGIIAIFTGFIGTNLGLLGSEWFQYNAFGLFSIQTWLASLFVFFIASIPLAFLFLLGLRISFRKVKKINKTLKLSLLGIWILSIMSITLLGVLQEKRNAFKATSTVTEKLPYTAQDTVFIKMRKNERFISNFDFDRDLEIRETANNEKVLVFQDLKIYIETTDTDAPFLEVQKIAKGPNYNEAQEKAAKIEYGFNISQQELILDAYALTDYNEGDASQKVKVKLILPENITIYADHSTKEYNNKRKPNQFIIINNKENHFLNLKNGKADCHECVEDENHDSDDINIDLDLNFDNEDLESKLEEEIESFIERKFIDEDHNLDINGKDFNIKINGNGIQIKTENH